MLAEVEQMRLNLLAIDRELTFINAEIFKSKLSLLCFYFGYILFSNNVIKATKTNNARSFDFT